MNILEQLSLAKKHPKTMAHITTSGDLRVGEVFEFVSHKPLVVGEMIYICNPAKYPYGRAVITNNPHPRDYYAKRTS
jgi:hypothetical protein